MQEFQIVCLEYNKFYIKYNANITNISYWESENKIIEYIKNEIQLIKNKKYQLKIAVITPYG